ncbi:bicyclomycin resistance protein, partial [Streptomyces sp. MCAF7]
IPVRTGTVASPDRYRRAWRASDMGVDVRKPMNEVFPDTLLDELAAGVGRIKRWGIEQGEGALVGALNGELPIPKIISAMTGGQLPPDRAAHDAAEEATALRRSLR